ncbi:sugar transferase, partial [Streptomyces sp. SID8455]|nr:sugar transferase [Streptomyces sp. SID8455]
TPLSFLLARWAIMSGRRAQATEASEATDVTGATGAAEAPEVSVPERPARPLPGRAAPDRSFAPRTTTHPAPRPSVRSSEDR